MAESVDDERSEANGAYLPAASAPYSADVPGIRVSKLMKDKISICQAVSVQNTM